MAIAAGRLLWRRGSVESGRDWLMDYLTPSRVMRIVSLQVERRQVRNIEYGLILTEIGSGAASEGELGHTHFFFRFFFFFFFLGAPPPAGFFFLAPPPDGCAACSKLSDSAIPPTAPLAPSTAIR